MTISQIFNDSGNGVFSSCIILEKNISYILCVGYYNYIKELGNIIKILDKIVKIEDLLIYVI